MRYLDIFYDISITHILYLETSHLNIIDYVMKFLTPFEAIVTPVIHRIYYCYLKKCPLKRITLCYLTQIEFSSHHLDSIADITIKAVLEAIMCSNRCTNVEWMTTFEEIILNMQNEIKYTGGICVEVVVALSQKFKVDFWMCKGVL